MPCPLLYITIQMLLLHIDDNRHGVFFLMSVGSMFAIRLVLAFKCTECTSETLQSFTLKERVELVCSGMRRYKIGFGVGSVLFCIYRHCLWKTLLLYGCPSIHVAAYMLDIGRVGLSSCV